MRLPQSEAGDFATTPAGFDLAAWKAILGRVWAANGRHNLGLMSAGVAFYAFLSFVPLLGALVMTYGLIADPATMVDHMRSMIDLVPREAAQLIYEQLANLSAAAATKKGLGLLVALLVSIYGATRASGAIITALNTIYEEEDKRGFIRGTLTSLALIMAAVAIGIVGIFAATTIGYAQVYMDGLGDLGVLAFKIVTWLAAGILCCVTIGGIYRFAPDRADARWTWLSLGSVVATLLWLGATLGFGSYAASFGNYGATYGSLGAVVILLMWLYLSAYAILLGGLLNAETEFQTSQDTTTGPALPMGERGAVMADTSAA
jgi:membrane protein